MDSSDDQIICSVCGEALVRGERMVRLPAIGFMHQDCKGGPWEGFTGQSRADADDALITDPLVRQISELRAALGDSEARRAELEAVATRLRERLSHSQLAAVMEAAPGFLESKSVVLEDRDREVAARTLEDAARGWSEWESFVASDGVTSIRRHGKEPNDWLRDRAAAIRKGDTNA